MKQSPFKFGEIVTGQHFTNRETEIESLQKNFLSSQNTIIISPRRYGKSSLVKEASERFLNIEKGYYFCFLDCMYVYSEEEFYSRFATAILKAACNNQEEFIQLAKKAMKGSRVTSTVTGEPLLELDRNYIKDNIYAILNLPRTIVDKKQKKVIVCIDEFQNISRFDKNHQLQSRLRSAWQHHDQVGYILYGSRNRMTEIFNMTNGPFYKFGETLYLNRIRTKRLREYVVNAFHSTGKEISKDICNAVIDTVENHPYYLQQFASIIWFISGKKVTKADFSEAKKALISYNLNLYIELLDNLTNYQIGFLKALLSKEDRLYSAEVISAYKLGSTANVRRMYNALTNKGIIVKEVDRMAFADPVFKLIAEERIL
ncbi:MAG: ATP-binding protein [Bacteroidales bacterium]|nr:ATP-binding protein [Bacteroidales bacterium]